MAHSLQEVSLPRFLERAGPENTAEIIRLWDEAGNHYLVLFSDATGEDIAILPVGPVLDYKRVEDVQHQEFDGLRAKCCVRARHLPESLHAWQVGQAAGMADAEFLELLRKTLDGVDAVARMQILATFEHRLKRLSQREQEIEHVRESLRLREQFITECENKLSSLAQGFAERESMIEQREQSLNDKERQFFRRVGESQKGLGGEGLAQVQ